MYDGMAKHTDRCLPSKQSCLYSPGVSLSVNVKLEEHTCGFVKNH